jgi:hypothetical protein
MEAGTFFDKRRESVLDELFADQSELVVVGCAGHDARDPSMSESIVAAIHRFAASA